ncbi:hypothetical protein BGZ58_006452 [Dissophora ornata]|nr:hypothetical protein BGZ58_006452 [Dissophora ornata]
MPELRRQQRKSGAQPAQRINERDSHCPASRTVGTFTAQTRHNGGDGDDEYDYDADDAAREEEEQAQADWDYVQGEWDYGDDEGDDQ